MIQQREAYAVTSTVPTDNKIAMSIRPEDMGKIMGILTDLYKNKLLAVLREYSTNALDANIDAGNSSPIRVTLPTVLSPFLTIADDGIGLDEEGILTYSQYGHSTKDMRNDVVGMLGLGCKAALTYTAQFTLTSVRDSVKRVAIISREADGSASVTPLSTEETDEANGTEVKVAINRSDYERCERLAAEFFSVWAEGTVEVNGKQPDRFEGLRVTDDLHVVDRGESRIVMGNVPYPAPELDDLCPMGGIIAYVKMGAVEFPPSREALQECKTTSTTIAAIRKRFETEARNAVQREIDKAETPSEAVSLAIKWDRYMPNGGKFISGARSGRTTVDKLSGYKFKGADLPAYLESENTVKVKDDYGIEKDELIPFTLSSAGDHRLGASRDAVRLYTPEWERCVWVEGYEPSKFTPQHKRKLNKFCADAGIENISTFVCVHGKMPSGMTQAGVQFLDAGRIIQWEEVKAIKLDPRPSRSGMYGRIPGSYDLVTEDGFKSGVPGDQIRQSKPIFWHKGNSGTVRKWTDAIAQERKAFTIVLLTENRIGKFKRNVPKAKNCRDFIGECHAKWAKALTLDERDALKLNDDYLIHDLKALDAGEVRDPDLKRAIKLAATIKVDAIDKKRDHYRRLSAYGTIESKIENPFARYPLFDLSSATKTHLYAYLNWVYETGN